MEPVMSRKDFFRYGFARLATGIADALSAAARARTGGARTPAPPPAVRFVRPPGARPEAEFLERCTRCDDCIKACPHWVVRKAGPELGATIEGTPILLPHENPCLFCSALPCIDACLPGALRRPAGGPVRIGLARVKIELCYQAQRQPCDYCEKSCPVRPRAIRVGSPGDVPAVDADGCTGCGQCAQICPGNALWIEDRR